MYVTCTVHVTNLNVNTSNSEQGIHHITLLITAYCYNINLEPTDMILSVQCLKERGLPRDLKRKTAGAWCNKKYCIDTTIPPYINIYRVSQEECARLRESVPYVKVYRYNPKHLYLKFNGYGDNGQRKVRSSCGSTYCTFQLTRYVYTAHVLETGMQSTLCLRAHVKCLEP